MQSNELYPRNPSLKNHCSNRKRDSDQETQVYQLFQAIQAKIP